MSGDHEVAMGDRGVKMSDRVVTILVDVGFHASTQPTRSAIGLQENQGDRGAKMGDLGTNERRSRYERIRAIVK